MDFSAPEDIYCVLDGDTESKEILQTTAAHSSFGNDNSCVYRKTMNNLVKSSGKDLLPV